MINYDDFFGGLTEEEYVKENEEHFKWWGRKVGKEAMFVTETTKFKCPYCNHEYERIVGSGINYEYQDKIYHLETCPECNQEFLCRNNEYIKTPEDKSKMKYHSCWIS